MQNGVGSERKGEINRRKKTWRGDQNGKGGRREEEEWKKGEKEERRVYLNPEGRGLSCFSEEFRRI